MACSQVALSWLPSASMVVERGSSKGCPHTNRSTNRNRKRSSGGFRIRATSSSSQLESWDFDITELLARRASKEKEPDVGFLSLSRAMELDRIDVDLSAELTQPTKSVLALQVEATRQGYPIDEVIKQDKPRWRMAPTKNEQKKWERARKASTGGSVVLVKDSKKPKINMQISAAKATEQYEKMKANLQMITLALGGVGTVSAFLTYSTETGISYVIGLAGAFAYVRMLSKSVDSLGGTDVSGVVGKAAAQPRLMVPVILVMTFNRWNAILVPEFGFAHLQLIPMLVGFLTYKIATAVEAFKGMLPMVGLQEED